MTEYTVRYRTDSDRMWAELPSISYNGAEISDMTPGELYTIEVNTVSYGLESSEPQQLNHTVRKYFTIFFYIKKSRINDFFFLLKKWH